jgi:hypothetical protein
MAMYQRTYFDFQRNGKLTTIADTDIAKIMYYINCVCTVIDYNDGNIQRYRNYSN